MVRATLRPFAGFKHGKMNAAEKCPVFVAIIRNVGVS